MYILFLECLVQNIVISDSLLIMSWFIYFKINFDQYSTFLIAIVEPHDENATETKINNEISN